MAHCQLVLLAGTASGTGSSCSASVVAVAAALAAAHWQRLGLAGETLSLAATGRVAEYLQVTTGTSAGGGINVFDGVESLLTNTYVTYLVFSNAVLGRPSDLCK